jgi:hypothetical protein
MIELLAQVMAQKWEVVRAEKGDMGTITVVLSGQSRDPLGVKAIPETLPLVELLEHLGNLRAALLEAK